MEDNVVVLTGKASTPTMSKPWAKSMWQSHRCMTFGCATSPALNPAQPVMFRYTAAGQGGAKKGQAISDEVQDEFKYYSQKARLTVYAKQTVE